MNFVVKLVHLLLNYDFLTEQRRYLQMVSQA